MEFPTFINWENPFQKGCWVISFYSCKQSEESDQMPPSAVFDLVLHCLSMSHKNDAKLK